MLISHQVFILEGLPILFCAVYTFFFLPNCTFPPAEIFSEAAYLIFSNQILRL